MIGKGSWLVVVSEVMAARVGMARLHSDIYTGGIGEHPTPLVCVWTVWNWTAAGPWDSTDPSSTQTDSKYVQGLSMHLEIGCQNKHM